MMPRQRRWRDAEEAQAERLVEHESAAHQRVDADIEDDLVDHRHRALGDMGLADGGLARSQPSQPIQQSHGPPRYRISYYFAINNTN